MTVDLAKLVSTTEDFEKAQLKAFEQFISDSKTMLSSVKSVEKKAEKQFKTLDGKVKELAKAPLTGSDKAPIETLKYDQSYQEAMANVIVEAEPKAPSSKELSQYVDKRSKQITDALDKKAKALNE